MATAIIRGVVVAASCRKSISICDCICHDPPGGASSTPPYQRLQARPTVPDPEDESFDFGALASHTCACLSCTQAKLSFDSFENAHLLSSTTYCDVGHREQQQVPQVPTAAAAAKKLEPIEHAASADPTSGASLGALAQKRSPLLGRKSLSRSKLTSALNSSFSLRTQAPYYTQRLLTADSIGGDKSTAKRQRNLVDHTAVEAISMSQGVTDINRNNGYKRNGAIMTASGSEKREHLYKILVIGELGTGKTSFIKRYVHQFFSQNYRATIGVDFALKVLHWDKDTIVRLQLWDIAGQERFGNMTRVYYKEAVGAFIVFDVTRSGTFDCVSKWKEDLDSKVQLPDGSPIPCILLANKCDQEKQGLVTTPEKMDEYVKENGFAGWFETSAKENINIDEAARALVNKILLNDKLISAADLADSEKFNLNTSGDQTSAEPKNKCSC